jgi:CoA:oxalate CoA-transferase
VPGPIGSRHPSITPFGAFEAADGHVIIAAGNDALFRKLCQIVGGPQLADDPRFLTNQLRCDHEPELRDALEHLLRHRSVATWLETLGAADLPCSPINNVAAVVADPQVQARNMAVRIDDPSIDHLLVAGNPIKISGHADPVTRPPAPALDADRAALLGSPDEGPDRLRP